MATLEDLQWLLGPKARNPWSSMMDAQDQSAPNASYQPNDMAMPPMQQPDYPPQPKSPDQPPPQGGSFSVSGTSMNPEMLAMYKQILAKSKESIGTQKDYLERLKNYRADIEKQPLEPDYTGLMMASDAWNGTKFQPQYKAPIDENQKRALAQHADLQVQNQLGNISKEELNMLKTQQEGLMQSLKYKEAGDSKVSDQDEKDRQNLMKALDTDKSSGRFTPVGKSQSNINQAQRIQALLDQYQADPNKMPLTGPASLSEIAIGLNSLLSATGGSEESRKSLIPSSARGKYSTLEQFILNEPVGANMEAFVKNAADTLKREQQTNQKQIDSYHDKLKNAWGLGRYAKRHPEEFNKLVNFYTTPNEAAQPAQGGGQGGSYQDPEKEKRYQEWKAKQK